MPGTENTPTGPNPTTGLNSVAPATGFQDRREVPQANPTVERRQFSNSHDALSPDARELATAIDEYKLHHRRRFITYEEMLTVIQQLGYSK